MSVISTTVTTGVNEVVGTPFNTTSGYVIPETTNVVLKNGAVKVDATYVYADLADSSGAAQKLNKEVAAKVIRSYLNASTQILKHYQGGIRSFDGDRVMAIFMGDNKNTRAVRAALAINWAVDKVIKPRLLTAWPTLEDFWKIGHGVGVDTGEALIVRGGVRNDNDLVSIGNAPNIAAKFSALRLGFATYITPAVYDHMQVSVKQYGDKNMWTWAAEQTIGEKNVKVLASNWHWAP